MKSNKGIEYILLVKGIFGRNRTVKFKTFQLYSDDDVSTKDESEVIERAMAKISEIGLKSGSYSIEAYPVTFSETDGITFKEVSLSFSDNQKILPWTALTDKLNRKEIQK